MNQSELKNSYYSRILPLYGAALQEKTIGILGDHNMIMLALLLAKCGVRRFATSNFAAELKERLYEQNPFEDQYEIFPIEKADGIIIGPGSEEVKALPATGLRVSFPRNGVLARIDLIEPREAVPQTDSFWPTNSFDFADVINRLGAFSRALLLRETPFEPSEIRIFFEKPCSTVLFGHYRWPWWIRGFEANEADRFLSSGQITTEKKGLENWPIQAEKQGKVLIVGCGSLGSLAAEHIASFVQTLVLSDPERVGIENLVRQAFSFGDIGKFKAEALASRLSIQAPSVQAFVRTEEESEAGEKSFKEFLDTVQPDLAILTTGTSAEYMMAKELRLREILHVTARCYARARYFEIIAVDGRRGPCFNCLREQVHLGPSPALTPEQKARYDPDYHPGTLAAEPATIIDSGRCSLVLSRIAVMMLMPQKKRPIWLQKTFQQERNCLIGANHAEYDQNHRWSYGINAPGQVATFGTEDIIGIENDPICSCCGKNLQTSRIILATQ